jgi:hypothetical protein
MDVTSATAAITAAVTPAIAIGLACIVALAGVWAFKLIRKVM